MEKNKEAERRRFSLWFWLGIGVMGAAMIPNLILGRNSIFTYHDQLDGELISYILQAKHLFSGDTLPEFMGGMSKTALTPPAPLFLLLFLGGNPLAALNIMQFTGRLVGFAGMYLLAKKMVRTSWIAAVVGGLYGLLPFLPVYGLSQHGIPLLFWCVLQIREKRHLIVSYCCVALFALGSSLVLAGFGLLGMGALWGLGELWRRRRKSSDKRRFWRFFGAWLLLLGIYVAENFRLLAQMLGMGKGIVSHKAEYVLYAEEFWSSLGRNLLSGGQHSEGYQEMFLPAMLIASAIGLLVFWGAKKGQDIGQRTAQWKNISHLLKCARSCVCWNFFFALTAALWCSVPGVALRETLGVLKGFQLDRLLWIAPCLWYLMGACCLSILYSLFLQNRGVCRLAGEIGCLALTAVAGVTGIRILLAGDIKSNLQRLRNPDYGMMSYSDYYAVGVLEQVEDFLTEQTGAGQEEYRVVSLGMDPAAALYNGFYCLDGYSNNYDLDYKREFRKVIAPELEKSDYLEAYFDEWGNRCYLFSAECPGYYTIEKNGFFFQDYQLDIGALKSLGCDYLFSAAYIQDGTEQGLVLMNETPFETADSYYRVYVYAISD